MDVSRGAGERPVLLYDGVCALCNGAVRFMLRSDRRGTFRFAPLEGEFARGVLARHPALRGVDSLVLVEPESATGREIVTVRSDAVLRVLAILGGPWRLALAARWLPRPLRDLGYDLIARHRYRVFGRYDTCPLPPPAVRDRFLP